MTDKLNCTNCNIGDFKNNLCNCDSVFYQKYKGIGRSQDFINAVMKPKWIPVIYHKITEEERTEEGYSNDWDFILDCEMPLDGEEILVTTRYSTVEKDVCCEEGGEYSLDSGYDWIDDIVAWMQLPEPYKG